MLNNLLVLHIAVLTYRTEILQRNANQRVSLLDVSHHVHDVILSLSGGTAPVPVPASGAELVALAILLRALRLRIVPEDISVTSSYRLHRRS